MSKFLALSSLILTAGFVAAQSAPSYTPPDPGPPPVRALPPSLDTATGPLSPVALSKLAPEEMKRPAAPHQRRVGVERALPNDLIARGKWLVAPTSTGVKTTWRVEILDPSAVGLRVHFKGYNGQGGLLWVHNGNAADPQFAGPFTDRGTFHDGDFWTEIIFGEKIVIEYQAPAGRDPSGAPPFQIAQLIHIFEFMGKTELSPAAALDTSCELDAACYIGNDNVALAAPSVVYLIIGGSQCTGTMINDKSSSNRAWMLTAGHCVTSDADARATTAYSGFQNKFCNPSTSLNYATLPSATGGTLLQQQFTTPGKTDFAFLLLTATPSSARFSGWDSNPIKSGENLISISNPRNLSNRFANMQAIQIGSTQAVVNLTQGRVDHGSSGSAAFDFATGNYIRGVLSSIANDESVSACALPSPFSANYTEFSTIFPIIDSYLSSTVPPVQTATFTANPNPIPAAGQKTTLSWNAPGHNSLVIKIGSIAMTGTVGSSGTADTGTWVTDGMVFSLIDTVTGATVSSLTVKVGSTTPTGTPTITANPNPIPAAGQITKLTWNAPGYSNLVIRVGSPTGPAMTGSLGSTGTVDTGTWVTDGMTFYLIDNSSGKSIASVVVKVGSTPTGTLSFTASPNPIHTGQTVGTTTLNWNAPGHQVIIRVNSATGVAMTGVLPSSGSTPTGNWVSNGMKFFLVDAGSGATLASLTVSVGP